MEYAGIYSAVSRIPSMSDGARNPVFEHTLRSYLAHTPRSFSAKPGWRLCTPCARRHRQKV